MSAALPLAPEILAYARLFPFFSPQSPAEPRSCTEWWQSPCQCSRHGPDCKLGEPALARDTNLLPNDVCSSLQVIRSPFRFHYTLIESKIRLLSIILLKIHYSTDYRDYPVPVIGKECHPVHNVTGCPGYNRTLWIPENSPGNLYTN